MKTKLTLALIMIFGILITGCKQNEQKIDIVNNEFPEQKAELQKVIDGIFKSFQDKDADKLISYHIYGPKFTEFRNDAPRFGSKENEEYERGFVGAISAFDYNLGNLKIDVFGDVAIVTFVADFRPTIANKVHQIWANVTLVFVKVNDTWKITHEHFSQFEKNKKKS
ncbi:MAG: nuclear transport factor 2 family protein [Bacteroidetes bacterium]|nr:nuclear transport factor 2 family protein [Bacteroidota bacterium]MCH8326558.1 nuclear transport factor 2 family protein [Bacteroidota bacterium]